MSVESVYPKVKNIVADVLVIDEADVALNKRLIGDLGAESIDFLDLVFQLEREFNIKIPRGQLEKNARGNLNQAEFEQAGTITPNGMTALRHYFSEVSESHFPASMKVSEIPTLFTVETFCKLVVTALAEKEVVAV